MFKGTNKKENLLWKRFEELLAAEDWRALKSVYFVMLPPDARKYLEGAEDVWEKASGDDGAYNRRVKYRRAWDHLRKDFRAGINRAKKARTTFSL